jgi:hypothetical protein
MRGSGEGRGSSTRAAERGSLLSNQPPVVNIPGPVVRVNSVDLEHPSSLRRHSEAFHSHPADGLWSWRQPSGFHGFDSNGIAEHRAASQHPTVSRGVISFLVLLGCYFWHLHFALAFACLHWHLHLRGRPRAASRHSRGNTHPKQQPCPPWHQQQNPRRLAPDHAIINGRSPQSCAPSWVAATSATTRTERDCHPLPFSHRSRRPPLSTSPSKALLHPEAAACFTLASTR